MLVDLFPFCNELDLLDLRMRELEGLADLYVTCELPVSFTGRPKPLVLHERLYGPLDLDLRIVDPGNYPTSGHPDIDWYQRRRLAEGIKDLPDDAWFILSDLDEIPNPDAVREVMRLNEPHPIALVQRLFYYGPQWLDPVPWHGPIVGRLGMIRPDPDLQELRNLRMSLPFVRDGGWHFSWMGPADRVRQKLQYVDIETENRLYGSDGIVAPKPEDVDRIVSEGLDLFGREHRRKQRVELDPGGLHPRNVACIL